MWKAVVLIKEEAIIRQVVGLRFPSAFKQTH
jgi:hypothetical protein